MQLKIATVIIVAFATIIYNYISNEIEGYYE
jgi:hypothetical protein